MFEAADPEARLRLFDLVQTAVTFAVKDFRGEKKSLRRASSQRGESKEESQHPSNFKDHSRVLSNITNIYNVVGQNSNPYSVRSRSKCSNQHSFDQQENRSFIPSFKSSDISNLLTSRGLIELIGEFSMQMSTNQERVALQSFIEYVVQVVLDFKDREMYDLLAHRCIKAGVFNPLLKMIGKAGIHGGEERAVARVLELCACHTEGVNLL